MYIERIHILIMDFEVLHENPENVEILGENFFRYYMQNLIYSRFNHLAPLFLCRFEHNFEENASELLELSRTNDSCVMGWI